MSRKKADPELRKDMCMRLVRLLRIAYDDNWAQFSRKLGYQNESTIQAVRDGRSFPDVQRLSRIADWSTDGDFFPSLHWIIAGSGPALVRFHNKEIVEGVSLSELAKRRAMGRRV